METHAIHPLALAVDLFAACFINRMAVATVPEVGADCPITSTSHCTQSVFS
jgi:hypothetical protein